jgi:hypothetical protein
MDRSKKEKYFFFKHSFNSFFSVICCAHDLHWNGMEIATLGRWKILRTNNG